MMLAVISTASVWCTAKVPSNARRCANAWAAMPSSPRPMQNTLPARSQQYGDLAECPDIVDQTSLLLRAICSATAFRRVTPRAAARVDLAAAFTGTSLPRATASPIEYFRSG